MIRKCIGCGIELQSENKDKIGFVQNEKQELCERCFKLKNYGEYQPVNLNNNDFQKIIDTIPANSLVIYVTSLLNLNLDYLYKFKNVLIVLTKKDLLTKSTKDYKIINYIKKNYHNYLDIEVISSIRNYNLDNLFKKIKKYGNRKPIYFVGLTNSGKSTLINKIIKNYADNNKEITTSLYPSTTLNIINIKIGNLKIIDTPGLLGEKSIINSLTSNEIKRITPKKEIKPRNYQLKGETSLLIDKYIRLDTHINDNIAVFLSNNLKIIKVGKDNQKFKKNYKYSVTIQKNQDIVIEDLCFIKFQKEADIEIYSPYQINILKRDNLI